MVDVIVELVVVVVVDVDAGVVIAPDVVPRVVNVERPVVTTVAVPKVTITVAVIVVVDDLVAAPASHQAAVAFAMHPAPLQDVTFGVP